MSVGFIGGKFYPLHNGHVGAILEAAQQCDELYIVLSHSEPRERLLSEQSTIKYISPVIRKRWLSILAKDIPNAQVIDVEDKYDSDETYNWEAGACDIRDAIGKPIDVVFSSEESYGEIFSQLYPGAEHVVIDAKRARVPISATQIRKEGVFAHWEKIPSFVQPYFAKKVVVVGTESCGKSTLVRQLAQYYDTTYVEEYGRTRCEEIGGSDGVLLVDDYHQIAYRQKVLEEEALQHANKILFVDTEAAVTQYYLELYEQEHSPILEEIIKTQEYDLWLFLEPDVAWVDDGLRVHGEEKTRQQNNKRLKELLDEYGITYHTISGNYHERFRRAVETIDSTIMRTN